MNPITDCLEAYLRPKWVLSVSYYLQDISPSHLAFIFNEKRDAIEMVTKWLVYNDITIDHSSLNDLNLGRRATFVLRFRRFKRGVEMFLSKSEESSIEGMNRLYDHPHIDSL